MDEKKLDQWAKWMSLFSHAQQNSKNDPTQEPAEQKILPSKSDKETTPNVPTSDVEASNTDIEECRSEPGMAEISKCSNE